MVLRVILAAGVPALVVIREMQDGEQAQHLAALEKKVPGQFISLVESRCSSSQIKHVLKTFLKDSGQTAAPCRINLDGAAQAARLLAEHI